MLRLLYVNLCPSCFSGTTIAYRIDNCRIGLRSLKPNNKSNKRKKVRCTMVAARKILVVDDEPVVTNSCQRILRQHGHHVASAESGQEALECALSERFDLVMTDLRLPDLDGMRLIRQLRSKRPETAIIIITGFGSVSSAAEAIRLGVCDYIEKPFTPEQITEAINRALVDMEGRNRATTEEALAEEVLKHTTRDPGFGQRLVEKIDGILSVYPQTAITEICARYSNDRTRMMDILRDVQQRFGGVSGQAMELIAEKVATHRVEVDSTVSFYSFLSKTHFITSKKTGIERFAAQSIDYKMRCKESKGKVIIRLCNDVIGQMADSKLVAEAFSDELGIGLGQTTTDGKITLEHTACIGMCDQAPAALINDVVVTKLSVNSARQIVRDLRQNMDPAKLITQLGDGNNQHKLVGAMVKNNVRKTGEVIFAEAKPALALTKTLAIEPEAVIGQIKAARLRGRGGAGFPTGVKWEFTRTAEGKKRYVICNADEGEPGTFKDRVILTERADLMFEGMTIAGYAIGADSGIVYLRAEYAYLRPLLKETLAKRRSAGLLGHSICGKEGFDFDIRIQMGAGSYVCGEETALISSCEGLPGDPKNRPPFPTQKGYLGCPTVVNNVETFCCVTRIMERGADWFAQIGSEGSTGTKLLSVSGDCFSPGVYELPFGVKLKDLLKIAGAYDAAFVQVGGPSGQMVGPEQFDRAICYDDLATGGAVMVFGPQRDVLEVVGKFMEFFIDEGCGFCTPCRVGNVLLKQRLDDIIAGKGQVDDLRYLEELGETIKATSRCGLGQTSANPVLTTLKNFRWAYEEMVREAQDGMQRTFDIRAALADAEAIAGRASMLFTKSA